MRFDLIMLYLDVCIARQLEQVRAGGNIIGGFSINYTFPHFEHSYNLASQRGREEPAVASRDPRRVFKDYSNRHSDLPWHENRFLGLMSAWKPVFMSA